MTDADDGTSGMCVRSGCSQIVRVPADHHGISGTVIGDSTLQTGTTSLIGKPSRPTIEEIFRAFDEAGGQDFELERDLSLPVERDLF